MPPLANGLRSTYLPNCLGKRPVIYIPRRGIVIATPARFRKDCRLFALAIALAEAGFARRSQNGGGAEPFEGSAVHVGFARRSQSAGASGPSEGPEVSKTVLHPGRALTGDTRSGD
jgi:hypothetical protein